MLLLHNLPGRMCTFNTEIRMCSKSERFVNIYHLTPKSNHHDVFSTYLILRTLTILELPSILSKLLNPIKYTVETSFYVSQIVHFPVLNLTPFWNPYPHKVKISHFQCCTFYFGALIFFFLFTVNVPFKHQFLEHLLPHYWFLHIRNPFVPNILCSTKKRDKKAKTFFQTN